MLENPRIVFQDVTDEDLKPNTKIFGAQSSTMSSNNYYKEATPYHSKIKYTYVVR